MARSRGGVPLSTMASLPRSCSYLLLLIGYCAVFAASSQTTVTQLHGSGTTNPSKLLWDVLETFESRSKIPLHLTYRAVGSSTGQKEFVGENNGFNSHTDFGSGDIPVSKANYDALTAAKGADALVHIPYVVGGIAVFYNLPGVTDAVKLDGCTLAKIFSRQITKWDDEAIVKLNPAMKASIPAGQEISVVHRVLGSSSTSGLTNYLNRHAQELCPTAWTLGAGSTVKWTADTVAAQGSGNMASTLQSTPYTIGYLDAGHGHSLGLGEIALQNRDGVSLTSKQATLGAAATQAIKSGIIPADSTQSFADVALYDLRGADTWPITMVSYFYVRTDLTAMDPTSFGVLKAMLEYVSTSEEGQKKAGEYSFSAIPAELVTYNQETIKKLRGPANAPVFTFETASKTQAYEGQGDYIISGKRKSFAEIDHAQMATEMAAVADRVKALEAKVDDHHGDDSKGTTQGSGITQLHGSGTTNPSKLLWDVLETFESRSKIPLHLTYRAVGSSTGQKEFVGENNGFNSHTDFGSGDIPVSKANYDALTAAKGADALVHIPYVVGGIAVFYNLPGVTDAVKLDGCTLAKIFSRQITKWDDEAIVKLNPAMKASIPAGQEISVVHRVLGSSSTSGLTNYLNRHAQELCPTAWTLGAGSTVKWTADTVAAQGSGNMASTLQSTPYTIGYLDAGHGHSLGLGEIALQNRDGVSLTSKQATLGAAATQAIKSGIIPADSTQSFADVALYDLRGADTWPITMVSYFYVRTDLTAMDPTSFGVLKAMLEYVSTSEEGQKKAGEYSFSAIPAELVTYNQETIKKLRGPANAPVFTFETASKTQAYEGQGDYIISGKRKSFAEIDHAQMATEMAAVADRVKALEAKVDDHHGDDSNAVTKLTTTKAESTTKVTTVQAKGNGDDESTKSLAIIALVFSIISTIISVGVPLVVSRAQSSSKQADIKAHLNNMASNI